MTLLIFILILQMLAIAGAIFLVSGAFGVMGSAWWLLSLTVSTWAAYTGLAWLGVKGARR